MPVMSLWLLQGRCTDTESNMFARRTYPRLALSKTFWYTTSWKM